jgi:hypothetical protein
MEKIKFFIDLQKSYEKKGKKIIKGIATGTLEDRDGERMSLEILEKFKNSLPLPLTDAHQQDGVFKDLGEVITGKIKKQSSKVYDLEIEAELDEDNLGATQLWNNLQKGKKYGLSIEAKNPLARTVFSETLNKNIIEFYDATPVAVSVTTRPSYIPSMIEVLSKSYKKTQDIDNISDIYNIDTMKEEKEIVKSEEAIEEVAENTETIITETPKEEVIEEVEAETEQAPTETIENNQQSDRITAIEEKIDKVLEQLASNQEVKKSMDERNTEILSKYEALENSFVELKKSFESMPKPKKSIASIVSKSFDNPIDPDLNSPISEVKQKAILRSKGIL